MRHWAGKLIFGMTCAAVATAAVPERYVSSRSVLVEFAATDATPVDDVLLWLSRDLGRTWRRAEIERVSNHTVRFDTPDDGAYWIYVVLKNAAGVSGEPPAQGSPPHFRVLVDTNPPLVQLHKVEVSAASENGRRTVQIRASILDEHLRAGATRLFYRANANAPWIDGGPVELRDEVLTWPVPEDMEGTLEFRLTVTDSAGNRSVDQTAPVELPAIEKPATTQPARKADAVDEPPADESATPAAAEEDPSDQLIAPQTAEQVARLRLLARKFLVREQYQLAEARLNDALKLAPKDAGVLVDLGQVSYRLKHYHDAQQRFADALLKSPDDAEALSGLALVAATEKRYSQAREHLSRLLELEPQAPANWLRLGDVEHRLGNRAQALEAWRKVLEFGKFEAETSAEAQRRLQYFDSGR